MTRPIIVDAEEQVACPKCNRRFALSEGISRHAIERHAEALALSLDKQKRTLEAEAAATAKRRAEADFEVRRRSLEESISAKESQLAKSRAEELQLRRQMRELEEARKSQELDYQRRLDAERKKIEERAGSARPPT
jgi:predicted NBD/HSP70 family sugar kinase